MMLLKKTNVTSDTSIGELIFNIEE